MRSLDLLHWIWRAVVGALRKSLLTALGMAIGIASVSLLTALGGGVRHYTIEQFSQFGTRIVAIHPGRDLTHGLGGLLASVRPLSLADADALRVLPGVEQVVPVVQGNGAIKYGNRERKSEILGVGPEMLEAWRFELAMGRFLPPDNSEHSRAYAVLGQRMKQELFASENPLGRMIRVGGMRFRVIGVMAAKGQMLGFDMDDIVYIPADRALQLFNRVGLMEIDITFSPNLSSTRIAASIRQRLIERHGEEDFTLTTQDEMLKTLDRVLGVLTLGVAALGGISLLVGGVGIATIMTTTVRERRAEIGLLRAIGAGRGQVAAMFLGEAMALAVFGGVLGLAVLFLVATGLTLVLPQLPLVFDPLYLLLAILVAALIGLLAGVVPALSAARLDPIAALHAE